MGLHAAKIGRDEHVRAGGGVLRRFAHLLEDCGDRRPKRLLRHPDLIVLRHLEPLEHLVPPGIALRRTASATAELYHYAECFQRAGSGDMLTADEIHPNRE